MLKEKKECLKNFFRSSKKNIGITLMILSCVCFIQIQCKYINENTSKVNKYQITYTIDNSSSSKIYIPKNLEDCFMELKKMLNPVLIEELKSNPESYVDNYHNNIGMWIRNNWGLWANSRLSIYFKALGITHADDMSSIILTSFWRHLNNKPIDLDGQISFYQEYWHKTNEELAAITPLPENIQNMILQTVDKDTLKLSDYKDKVIILYWWDMVTEPSRKLVTEMANISKEYNDSKLVSIGIISEKYSEDALARYKKFIGEKGIKGKNIYATKHENSLELYPYALPQVFIISCDGSIIKRFIGYDPIAIPSELKKVLNNAIKHCH